MKVFVAGQETLIGRALSHQIEPVPESAAEFVIIAGGKSGGIRANQKFPATLMLDNLRLETLVIEATPRRGVKRLLYLAISGCYPKNCPPPTRVQAHLPGPTEP